jgi:putative flippase GtrA
LRKKELISDEVLICGKSSFKCLLNDILDRHDVKVKFVLVGIWNTVFGYLAFILLETLFSLYISPPYLAYMSAMVLAQIIAVINAFIFHKYVTFKSSAKGKELIREFFRFTTTYIFTFFISLVLLPVFVEFFHITPKISGAIIIFIFAIISYLGHSKFSFAR